MEKLTFKLKNAQSLGIKFCDEELEEKFSIKVTEIYMEFIEYANAVTLRDDDVKVIGLSVTYKVSNEVALFLKDGYEVMQIKLIGTMAKYSHYNHMINCGLVAGIHNIPAFQY